MKDQNFLPLAKKLSSVSRRYDTHELVTLAKFLVLLNVSEKSILATTVFQVSLFLI